MPKDPYALLRALMRAEAARDTRAAKAAAPAAKNRRAPAPQDKNGR
ncbi:hypothetical protein OKJ48_04920 [Streptomyces kunmingensis]|uniref:Uncharacterized protein n=1 Tax=Streptomyces kunmingensis TaxID=68225 RepID=A0ABU6C5J4_9ACTN|nr:hypothetical protein [Streptomyces kunmingensis]MEB3959595.1 hypothetical protein [Streptomyces kunmingensis]